MEHSARIYRFGKFTVETRDRRLTLEGREVYLRPKTYETLLFLLERQGHLVTKDALLDGIWSDVEVSENALTRCIKEVRAALGDEVQNPHFLRTVPRLGYEFIADVQRLGDEPVAEFVEEELRAVRVVTTEEESDGYRNQPAAGQGSQGMPSLPAPIHWSVSARTMALAGGFAALALVAIASVLGLNVGGWRDRLLGRPASAAIGSLAVLPLANLTGDPQQEYFADGMTEELISNLGAISALRVISRTSITQYKKTNKSLPQIARELNVDAIIEGAVLRAGNRVRITAQLIQGSTDRRLWGGRYERELRDVLTLQSEVARDIASGIKATVTPQEQVRFASRRPVKPEAYDLYVRGKMFLDSDNKAAAELLERAVGVDPDFAPAYAALGRAYADRLFLIDPKDEWKEKAEAAVEKAISLDPDLADAHVSRAMLLFTPAHGWQFEAAIRELRGGLALDPNLAAGHMYLAGVFLHVGLLDEALEELRTAAAINPTEPDVGWFTGLTLWYDGKLQDALPYLGMPHSPSARSIQAIDLWEMGRKQEAWAQVRELLKSDPQEKDLWLVSAHALLLANAGERREAELRINHNILRQAEQLKQYGHFHHVANILAAIYAQLNDPEQAVAWLEQTAANGFPCYPAFQNGRGLDPIRQDPRFIAFMQKLKPQWEYYKSVYGSEHDRH
jgi:TolB-like protein/DNA-binding winged helix-turn-helix (wHTH) protein/Tfp pilus assembly protein PilF